MIGVLPTSLEIGGRAYPIDSDFRTVLNIFEAFGDSKLTDEEKCLVCLYCLYEDVEAIPQEHIQEAVDKAYWFCDGGDMPKSAPEKVRTLDWAHDEGIIFPAVNKTAGFEVRNCEYMHWWTFLGIFGEISEGLFTTVMHIRQKKAQGKKLEKWEREFFKKNRSLVEIINKDDKRDMEEDEAFLKELLKNNC